PSLYPAMSHCRYAVPMCIFVVAPSDTIAQATPPQYLPDLLRSLTPSSMASPTAMQSGSRLYNNALKVGGPTFGGLQMLPGTNHSLAIVRSDVDWICVNDEHGNIADNQMHEAVAAIAACCVSPIVRIFANEAWMVKRALDAGAHDIFVPLNI